MDETGEGLLDLPAVEAWLDANVPALGSGPLRANILAGGATNAVFLIERDSGRAVLRRPPRVPRPDSDRILGREARVLAALGNTDVPAPRLFGHCADSAVNGAAFYVMSYADGWVGLGDFPPPFDAPGAARRNLAFELVGGIAKLANVDYQAIGLDGFGKPDGFLRRQVDRWLHQLDMYRTTENYAGRELPGLDYVSGWLQEHLIESPRPGIIHGDYGFANAMFVRGDEAKLLAMVDWELSTVGDPLLDLGWVLYGFRSERDPVSDQRSAYFDPAPFPSREELAHFYAERTGLPVNKLDYYLVLAQFKLAVLLERKYAESLIGQKPKAYGDMFADMVLKLLRQAEAVARGARL